MAAGTIEMKIPAVLVAIGIAQLLAGDLADGVPIVGGLERARVQSRFADRPHRQTRVNARGRHERPLAHAAPRAPALTINRLSYRKSTGRVRLVLDATHDCGRHNRRVWADLQHPGFDVGLTAQIQLRTIDF